MSKIRNIIIFVVILIIILLIFIYFKSPSNTPSLVTTSPQGTVVPTSGDTTIDPSITSDFLGLLLSVKSIKLDDSIFQDEAFKSLHDSSIELTPDGTEGRPNPFAPFGNDNVSAPSTTTPSTIPPATTTPSTTNPPTSTAPATSTTTTTTTSPSGIQFPSASTPPSNSSVTPPAATH